MEYPTADGIHALREFATATCSGTFQDRMVDSKWSGSIEVINLYGYIQLINSPYSKQQLSRQTAIQCV